MIRPLGRGGMAEVHEAEDVRTGRRVALKRLLEQEDPAKSDKARQLFEREFHTLSQLSHPRIVEVYDYSVDELGPFYTMELLSGGDLSQLVPLDHARACRLAKDICSALSLLHSRGFVHRDLSPRNVRCTAEGQGKLIDFGAMAPMGHYRSGIVGTPAYCPPEVVNGQALDARTDLFALGATLYYALTGRHAYPAKDFASLPERWQCACPSPAEFVPEIPEKLDALVMELLRLDPVARPPSAFEVIARLCAIDGVPFDEHLLVAQAYVSTPQLVGRDAALSVLQRKLSRAERGRGRALAVSGPPGVGRSRFLDAVALEARLKGATVIAVDADDGRQGDYGVVRAMVRQLTTKVPERVAATMTGELALLGYAIPELSPEGASDEAPSSSVAGRPRMGSVPNAPSRSALQQALRRFFVELAAEGLLVVTVDDVHEVDEPSAALLALLAHDARDARLLLVVSLEPNAPATSPGAMKLLLDAAEQQKLSVLGRDETDKLMRSIFGNVPNVGLLSHRIHEIAAGNPRDTMQLAQHLIDRKAVRYEAGAWSVPDSFDAQDLPATMAQALEVTLASMAADAREIACALSLAPGLTITLDELTLLGAGEKCRAGQCLDQLVRGRVLCVRDGEIGLAQEGWGPVLQNGTTEEARAALHLRLAVIFERRGNDEFRRGKHLLRGGDTERGLDVLCQHSELSQEETGKDPRAFLRYLQSLPPDWLRVYEDAIELCSRIGRPKRDTYLLRSRLGGIISTSGKPDRVNSRTLVAALADYSGLATYYALDATLDPGVRLMTALRTTAQRYEASPPSERVIDPRTALTHLGRAVIQAAGTITTALDGPFLRALPSLAPLVPLSPAFSAVQALIDGMVSRTGGRLEEARATYVRLVNRLDEPDKCGLEGSHAEHVRSGVLNGIAMIEAGMGLPSTMNWVETLEEDTQRRITGMQVRSLYHLWQGNAEEANRLKREVELLVIQENPIQLFGGNAHLLWQIIAYGLTEDLTHLKQTNDEVSVLASRHDGWVPVRHYGTGEYHRAGGAYAAALSEFDAGLGLAHAGEDQIWSFLAAAQIRTLYELGRLDAAREAAERHLAANDAAGLGYVKSYLLMPYALVLARLGRPEAALTAMKEALACFTSLGTTGLNMGLAHETAARVALLLGDRVEYTRYLGLCRDAYTRNANPALVTKFEKLRRSASIAKPKGQVVGNTGFFSTTSVMVGTSRLDLCQGADSRAKCALAMVMDQCGATAGVLYLVGAHGPFAAASQGHTDPMLGAYALEYLASEIADASTTGESGSLTTGDSKMDFTGSHGEKYRPVLLTHDAPDGFLITGVAVIEVSPDAPFAYPTRVAAEVSRHLKKSGDVTGMVVTD